MFYGRKISPALDMLKSTLLYIKQGLNTHIGAFSPVIIIEDHIYRVLFTHSFSFYYTSLLMIVFSWKNCRLRNQKHRNQRHRIHYCFVCCSGYQTGYLYCHSMKNHQQSCLLCCHLKNQHRCSENRSVCRQTAHQCYQSYLL